VRNIPRFIIAAALSSSQASCSYATLSREASRVSTQLERMLPRTGESSGETIEVEGEGTSSCRVAVVGTRGSPELVAATLGVWIAGCTPVPMSPLLPPARITAMLQAAGCTAALLAGGRVSASIATAVHTAIGHRDRVATVKWGGVSAPHPSAVVTGLGVGASGGAASNDGSSVGAPAAGDVAVAAAGGSVGGGGAAAAGGGGGGWLANVTDDHAMGGVEKKKMKETAGVSQRQHSAPTDAYVLFTSGTTREPLACFGSMTGLVDRCTAVAELLPYRDSDATEMVIARTSIGFVDAVTEVFGALAAGGPVLLCPEVWSDHTMAVLALCNAAAPATRVTVVPTMLSAMTDVADAQRNANQHSASNTTVLASNSTISLSTSVRRASAETEAVTSAAASLPATPECTPPGNTLRTVVCSGASLRRKAVYRFRRAFSSASTAWGVPTLANLYGSTEVCGDVTLHVCTASDEHFVGRTTTTTTPAAAAMSTSTTITTITAIATAAAAASHSGASEVPDGYGDDAVVSDDPVPIGRPLRGCTVSVVASRDLPLVEVRHDVLGELFVCGSFVRAPPTHTPPPPPPPPPLRACTHILTFGRSL
jgi:acyl-CoA synthetase (AMP-forming)/AMP-acid ligase II